MLYTVYATPNIVLPFVGGLMVDKFGANQILLLLTVLVCVGQVVVAFGSFIYSFRIMLVRGTYPMARRRVPLSTNSETSDACFLLDRPHALWSGWREHQYRSDHADRDLVSQARAWYVHVWYIPLVYAC